VIDFNPAFQPPALTTSRHPAGPARAASPEVAMTTTASPTPPKTVVTRDGRFAFSWPLPEHIHPKVIELEELPGETTAQARLRLNALLQAGHRVVCNLTGTTLFVYRRTLTQKQVSMLSTLWARSLTEGDWLHYRTFSRGNTDGDLAKMVHWGLVERALDAPKYAITPLGKRWLHGLATIPKAVAIFRGECLGAWDDERIRPKDVDDRFEYGRLVGEVVA
jgi:hypothetical protein